MKHSCLAVFLISLYLSFLVSSHTSAQDFTFSHAYQDYLYNYNLYRQTHQEYLSAKNEYQAYQTLTAENRAIEATRKMLTNRAGALHTYLTALRMKLRETTNIINYQQNLQYLKLDNEITWLVSHKDSLSSPNSLEELTSQSSQLEQKYPAIEVLAYQTLGTILSGKENSLREKLLLQVENLEETLAQMKNEGENIDKLNQWLEQTKKKIVLSEEKQKEAEGILKVIRTDESDKRGEFEKAQAFFKESNQALSQATGFLGEIIREISKA